MLGGDSNWDTYYAAAVHSENQLTHIGLVWSALISTQQILSNTLVRIKSQIISNVVKKIQYSLTLGLSGIKDFD